MKNLKKVLALVVVFAMMLSTVAFAAPTDVKGTKYESAVGRLAALNILAGFPDGTFKPGDAVTRAQMAKIICSAVGVGTAAEYAAGESVFSDVAADHWAAGYIKVAADMGIINGMGDGRFAPEEQVTYAQAIKMVVAALGYTPKAEAMGGYPGGYLAVAAEKKITKGISVVSTLGANRGDIAMMVDAAMTVDLMVQKTYGQYPEYEEAKGKTLLSEKLNAQEFPEVVVTSVPAFDGNLKSNQVRLDGTAYKVIGEMDLNELFGLEVTAWANDDDEILYIKVEDGQEVFTAVLKEFYPATKKVEFKSGYTGRLDVADDATMYINAQTVAKSELSTLNGRGDFAKDVTYGRVVVKDGEVTFGNFFNFNGFDTDLAEVGVVTSVDGDEIEYVSNEGVEELLVDLSDYDNVYVFNAQLGTDEVDNIVKGSVITFFEYEDNLYVLLSDKEVVTGTVTKFKSDAISIDGKNYDRAKPSAAFTVDEGDTYEKWNDSIDDTLDDLMGEEVALYLDVAGRVVLLSSEVSVTSDTIYGVVTFTELNKDGKLTVFTKDGEVVYTAEKRTDISGLEQGNDTTHMDYYGATGGSLKYAVVSFKLNSDGEIKEGSLQLEAPVIVTDQSNGSFKIAKEADKDYVVDNSGNRYYISKDTVVITAIDGTELDPSLMNYEDLIDMKIGTIGTTSTYENAVVFGAANKDAKLIVFLSKDFVGSKDDVYYGITVDNPWKVGDNWIAKIDIQGEGIKEVVVDNKDDFANKSLVAFKYNNKNKAVLVSTATTAQINAGTHYKSMFQRVSNATHKGLPQDEPIKAGTVLTSILASNIPDGAIVAGKVYDAKDNYLDIYVNAKANGSYAGIMNNVRVASDAVIYEVTLDSIESKFDGISKSRFSRIVDEDFVIVLFNDDREVSAMFIKAKKNYDKLK